MINSQTIVTVCCLDCAVVILELKQWEGISTAYFVDDEQVRGDSYHQVQEVLGDLSRGEPSDWWGLEVGGEDTQLSSLSMAPLLNGSWP